MRKKIILAIAFLMFGVRSVFAWGPEGHAIVGRLALNFVTDDVRQNVLKLLDGMSMDTAANWMDIMKSNADYEFMRPWHHLDFAKDQAYKPTIDDNLMTRLTLTFKELQHKKVLCEDQVKFDLLVLLHLMGDLQMPLHSGYEEDLGGNRRMVQYDTLKTHNLHWFWDEDIIRLNKITYEDCMALYTTEKSGMDTIKTVNFVAWMNDSRRLLDQVYDLKDGYIITDQYLLQSKHIVAKQLLLGGLRLATVLNKLFYSASPVIDFKDLTRKAKGGIDAIEAKNNVGKEVAVCEHVYSYRETASNTQFNLGAKYPNNPLTIIIFAKSYANFPAPPAELYRDKNICVRGKIELYRDKPQIIVEKPGDITVY